MAIVISITHETLATTDGMPHSVRLQVIISNYMQLIRCSLLHIAVVTAASMLVLLPLAHKHHTYNWYIYDVVVSVVLATRAFLDLA